MRKLLMLCALLVALPVQAQQGKKGGAALDARLDTLTVELAVERARIDSVIAALAGHGGRLATLEAGQQVQNTDRTRIEARLDSLIAALAATPPDTVPPDTIPPIPPATGDTAVIIAQDASSVTIEATWTAQPVDETLKTRPSDPRLNVRDAVSPYTFTAPKQAARSLLVAIERWDRTGTPVYLGDDTLAVIDIPASGAPPDTTTPPPSGNIKQVAQDIVGGPGPNEPAGFTRLDPSVRGNWDILYDYGQHQECSPVDGRCFQNPSRATDPSFPNNPGLRNTWPTGFGDDSLWPGTRGRSGGTRINFLDTSLRTREGYVSVRFRLSPNVQIGPTGLKIVGIKKPKRGGSAQMAWILATGMGAGQLTLDQKIASGDFQSSNSPRTVRSGFHFAADTPYYLEVYVKTNTAAGVPDGIATVWLNGVRRIHLTDVVWYADEVTEAAKAKWVVGALIDPIPSARVPAPENWVKYDDLYVSTR